MAIDTVEQNEKGHDHKRYLVYERETDIFQWEDPKDNTRYTVKPYRHLFALVILGEYKELKATLESSAEHSDEEIWCSSMEMRNNVQGFHQAFTKVNIIHLAVILSKKNIVGMLLEHGLTRCMDQPFSEYTIRNFWYMLALQGGCALHLAIYKSSWEIVDLLLDRKANINKMCDRFWFEYLPLQNIDTVTKYTPNTIPSEHHPQESLYEQEMKQFEREGGESRIDIRNISPLNFAILTNGKKIGVVMKKIIEAFDILEKSCGILQLPWLVGSERKLETPVCVTPLELSILLMNKTTTKHLITVVSTKKKLPKFQLRPEVKNLMHIKAHGFFMERFQFELKQGTEIMHQQLDFLQNVFSDDTSLDYEGKTLSI